MSCRRCQGLMVWDWLSDGLDGSGDAACRAQRCVICGEIVDPVVVANRASPPIPRRRLPGRRAVSLVGGPPARGERSDFTDP